MYGRYTHQLLLAVAQDSNRRILPTAFAIILGEKADDSDFFLSRLRRHVCPQPHICIISNRGVGYYLQLNDREAFGIACIIGTTRGMLRQTITSNIGLQLSDDKWWTLVSGCHQYYLGCNILFVSLYFLVCNHRYAIILTGYEIMKDSFHKMFATLR